MHIYKIVNRKLKFSGEINAGITSALLHLDWDVSSNLIVVNSQAYELKFISSESLQVVRASSVQSVQWQSWTCKIGFPVQGIYPGASGFEVNCVDRSNS